MLRWAVAGMPVDSIQWVLGVASRGLKRPGPEADHSFLSGLEIMNEWNTCTLPVSMACIVTSFHLT